MTTGNDVWIPGNHVWDFAADWCRWCHLTAEAIARTDRLLPCVLGSWLEAR